MVVTVKMTLRSQDVVPIFWFSSIFNVLLDEENEAVPSHIGFRHSFGTWSFIILSCNLATIWPCFDLHIRINFGCIFATIMTHILGYPE